MKRYGNLTRITGAVVALALSATAFANHNDEHVRGTGPGSKVSLDVENHCVPLQPGVDDVSSPTLKVTSTIRNEGEGAIAIPVVVDQKSVTGMQLVKATTPPKNKSWDQVGLTDFSLDAEPPLGDPNELLQPESSRKYVSEINLCGDSTNRFDANAIALNAEVKVMIRDGEGNIVRSFIGNCDDLNIVDEYGNDVADESRIDFDDPDYEWLKGWRGCP